MALISTGVTMTQVRNLSYKSVLSWYSGLVKSKPREAPFDHIVQIGDPTLRTTAQEIPPDLIKSSEIRFLIKKMEKVMNKYNCVGLAAPQIGIPFRLFLMQFTEKQLKAYKPQERQVKEMEVIPLTVVINPKMEVTDYTKLTFTENCESVRGFHAEVARYRGVKVTARNSDDGPLEFVVNGWPARIVQHEFDHLNGKIYTDTMIRQTFACSCWQVINDRRGKVELPYGAN